MNEQDVRDMVRQSIARQLGHAAVPSAGDPAPPHAHRHSHASSALLPLPRGGDGDGACIIEPSVRCNHCGYCLSYGH
jgi:hypothetical protein